MSSPLVTIIIPVYNTEKYVRRAVDSALAQTYSDIEIILVNDGSTDASGTICDDIASEQERVKVIHQVNGGVSSARNTGLGKSSGEYIQFLDSDDIIDSTMTEDLISFMIEQSCDLVICGYATVGRVEQEFSAPSGVYQAVPFITLAYSDRRLAPLTWSSCNMLFKKSILKEHQLQFDDSFVMGEDGLFTLEYMSKCQAIGIISSTYYKYYQYTLEERTSAIAHFSPDLYQFRIHYFEKLNALLNGKISKTDMQKLLQSFCDFIIMSLVYMVAYSDFFEKNDLRTRLKFIVHHPLVIRAVQVYRRTRPTDSRIIPILVKWGSSRLLMLALRRRGKQYIEKYGKRPNVRSIYRKGTVSHV